MASGEEGTVAQMELLAFIFGLCALGALAMRFGRDSRDLRVRSDEQRLASYGMSWGTLPTPRRQQRRRPVAHTLRHPIAAALYRVAHWLAPEVSRATG
jgi:hypothetical protein